MMRVAVVTPYHNEPLDVWEQCCESVRMQTFPVEHFVVNDGCMNPPERDCFRRLIQLPVEHNDFGNFARGIGALAAASEGFDAIAFLDADNWYAKDHIENLVWNSRDSDVVVAKRTITDVKGKFLFVDHEESEGSKHVDTNCFFVRSSVFYLLPVWVQIPIALAPMGDRIFLRALQIEKAQFYRLSEPTVYYRSRYKSHYRRARLEIPEDAIDSHIAPDVTRFDIATTRITYELKR